MSQTATQEEARGEGSRRARCESAASSTTWARGVWVRRRVLAQCPVIPSSAPPPPTVP